MNDSLMGSLWSGVNGADLIWEAGLLLAVILLIWPLPNLLRSRLERMAVERPRLNTGFGAGLSSRDWRRLTQPPLILLAVLVLREGVLLLQSGTPLLDVAVPLLLSMSLVQGLFYVLRRIVNPSTLLHSLENLVSWGVWVILALHLTGNLDGMVKMLDAVGLEAGNHRISIYTALLGLLTIATTLILALWLARSLETRFIERMPVNANLKTALTKAAKTLLVLIAVLIALPVVGIDLTMLSVFGGALGVGVGLGLQKVAANYFSGFTLLLDQSIRLGDMVTVDGHYGEVEDIRTRYTVLRGLDNTEIILPNEAMVTSIVINHTMANRENLLRLSVDVAYDTDLDQASQRLVAVANTQPRVIRRDETHVRLEEFGENGISLELVCWIEDPENGVQELRSDIRWAIWRAFRDAGIEIPYPQRVVHLKGQAA